METRLYYSLNEVGLEVWNATDGSEGPEQVAKRLTEVFEVDADTARDAVSTFLPELERERLVVESDGEQAAPAPAPESAGGPRPFEVPQLIKHDEPLHEVANKEFDPQLPLAE